MVAIIGKSQSYGNSIVAAVVGLIYNYSNTDTWYCGGILAYQQYTMCINTVQRFL